MDGGAMMDSQNVFLVIILVIIIVALSTGLLAFICTQLMQDKRWEGVSPKSIFKSTRKRTNPLPVVVPTQIVVTRPASDVGSLTDIGSLADVRDYSEPPATPQTATVQMASPPQKKRMHASPHKIIYSCDNSPALSPTKKVFIWSRNNSYDFSNDSGKSYRGQSPLGVYRNFAARRNSAPMKPTRIRSGSVFF